MKYLKRAIAAILIPVCAIAGLLTVARAGSRFVLGIPGNSVTLPTPLFYLPLDEASGDALDVSAGGNTLTATNAPGATSGGKGGAATARTFVAASSQLFSKTILDTALGFTTSDSFAIVAWVWIDDTTNSHTILTKRRDFVAGHYNYILRIDSGVPHLYVGNTGTTNDNVVGWHTGISTGAWHLIIAGNNAGQSRLEMSVDGGAYDTVAIGSTVIEKVGTTLSAGSYHSGEYWNGRGSQIGIFGQSISVADVATFWNNGNGRAFNGSWR